MPPVSRRTGTGVRKPRVAGRTRDAQASTEVLEPPVEAPVKRAPKPRPAEDPQPTPAVEAEPFDEPEAVVTEATEPPTVDATETETEQAESEQPESEQIEAEPVEAQPAEPETATPVAAPRRPRGRAATLSLRKPVAAEPDRRPAAQQQTRRRKVAALFAPPRTRRGTTLYAVAALLLVAAAAFFGMSWFNLEYTGPAANKALIDVGATAQVSQQLGDDLKTVYSFDFARLDENEKAARAVITPEFEQQFDQIFADVRARAPQQKAVVTATVAQSAVRSIEGDTAVAVVFLDQIATRTADNSGQQQLASAGRLTVTGKLVDGRWKIADVKAA